MIKRMSVAFVLLAIMMWALVHLFRTTPTSFVPNEDQGYVMAQLIMPDAASLNRTAETASRSRRAVRETVRRWQIARSSTATACSTASTSPTQRPSSSRSRISKSATHRAKPPPRENFEAVLRAVGAEARNIETGLLVPIAPPAIPGIGTTGGFEFWIQDKAAGDPTRLYDITQQFLAKARQRPELTGLTTTFRASSQQLRAEVDRSKAVLLGVPVQDVYSALQAQFGSIQVESVQPVQPGLERHPAIRRAVPTHPRRPHPTVHAIEQRSDGAAVGRRDDELRDRSRPGAALQRLSRQPRSPAPPLRGSVRETPSRPWKRWRTRCCRRAMAMPGRGWPTRRSSRAARPRWPSSSDSSSCFSCSPPSSSRGLCPAPS